jgi:hypothetical protein
LIDAQTIILDGLEAAVAECEGELQPLLAAMLELSRERNAQLERDELQQTIAAALNHGIEVLRFQDEVQVHFAAFLALEKTLRDRDKHSEAGRVLHTLRAHPNYFSDGVWRELARIQPWEKRVEDNKQRYPESQAASAA